MQVAIHLGFHCTDEDKLLRSLLQNVDILSKEGISVPGPGRYRKVLRRTAAQLRGKPADENTSEKIRKTIMADDTATRVVLSDENLICVHGRIFESGILYEKAEYKANWVRNVFPDDDVEFFIAIKNPATFIPNAYYHKLQNHDSFEDFLSGADIKDALWSDVILAVQESNPGCPITVWCNEDTPLIWGQLMRELCGLDALSTLDGEFNLLSSIMHPHGMKRMTAFLRDSPPQNEIHKRRIIAAFLDKFAIEDLVDLELDAPGWTQDLIDELTAIYDNDVAKIQRLPGVTLIEP